MPTSIRLDSNTERIVERLAREKGMTKSAVIREAIHKAGQKEKASGWKIPYERMKHLIGCVNGLPPDLSENTGQKFREILLAKQSRRR